MSLDVAFPDFPWRVTIRRWAAYVLCMRRACLAIAALAAAISFTSCGGSSTKASRDCFDVWNAGSNKARQSSVAGRFTLARVNNWRAESSGGGNVNLGGQASEGCGYLFHTSTRFLSISGAWNGNAIRWDVPPTIHGSWSPQQQAASADNATVDADGLLSHEVVE